MHAQIWQLLKYFQSIQKVIKYTCKGQCRNFVDTIQTGKDRAIADSTTGISLTDLQAQVSSMLKFRFAFRTFFHSLLLAQCVYQ